MDLIDQLKTIAARAQQRESDLTNEEATKMTLVAPFIKALGYDIFDPAEVKPEFPANLPGVKKEDRVDYAILENGEPKILIEAKTYGATLTEQERGQLGKYFVATKARVAILTNGKNYQFFSDLDEKNLMDEKPFAELDIFDLENAPLEQLKQMSKPMFNIDVLLSSAERLKHLRGVKDELRQELSDPSEWLVKAMATRVHPAKKVTPQLIERFKPIVVDAIKEYINERIHERLKKAEEKETVQTDTTPEVIETEATGNGIITTEEELEGLYITRAICASEVEPSRITDKDTKNYFNILLDRNSWKPIVRLHFNGSQKKVEIYDNEEPKFVPIEKPMDLYKLSDRIIAALKTRL